MSLADLPNWAKSAVVHKEDWMASGSKMSTPPALLVERDGHPFCMVLVLGDDDVIYKAILTVNATIDPSAINLMTEAYYAIRAYDDGRGEELLHAIERGHVTLSGMADEGGIERGSVGETMFVFRREADGKTEAATMPFRTLSDNSVSWDDREAAMMPGVTGKKPDLIRDAMADSDDLKQVIMGMAVKLNIPIANRPYHMIRAGFRTLVEQGCVVVPFHPQWREYIQTLGKATDKRRRPDPETLKRKKR